MDFFSKNIDAKTIPKFTKENSNVYDNKRVLDWIKTLNEDPENDE